MTEPLAHKLVMAAQNASEDCGCGPNESAIVAAVLWELAEVESFGPTERLGMALLAGQIEGNP